MSGVNTGSEEFAIVLPIKLKKVVSKFGGRLDDDNENYRTAVIMDIKTTMSYMKPFILD